MRPLEKIAFGVAAALGAVFFANVAIGALGHTPYLNDVLEMLTLLAAVAAFIVGVLRREARTLSEAPGRGDKRESATPPGL